MCRRSAARLDRRPRSARIERRALSGRCDDRGVLEREALFVETMHDLRHKLRDSGSTYELLRSSALMRQLLIDGSPLMHQINRKRQVPVQFHWVELRPDEFRRRGIPTPQSFAIGFAVDGAEGYPNGVMCAYHASGGDQSFLKAIVALEGGEPITVRDMIKHAANVDGGVHAGVVRASEAGQQRLEQLRSSLLFYGGIEELARAFGLTADQASLPGGPATLRAVGRVLVRGLDPLVREVKRDAGTS